MTVSGETRRVAVAMSGGVDSSVAAALLLERGYHVEGISMRLWRASPSQPSEMATREEEGQVDARRVCDYLGIPHHLLDLRQAFHELIVGHFVSEYARGRTPNPCLRCNLLVKFGLLMDCARELDLPLLATGHYARVGHERGLYQLLCGVDTRKDQAYFLYALTQEQLGHALFPLGGRTKTWVRERARALGLPVAERDESQDICFLPDGDYRSYLRSVAPQAVHPGPIYDTGGRELGEHQGLPLYTVGQRQGLGISAPRALYVLRLDVGNNALVVGYAEELGRRSLLAEQVGYVSGQGLGQGQQVQARIRYRARRVPAQVWSLLGGRARVAFDEPLAGITPGQAVVFYDGERVLGGGIIAQTAACDPATDG